VYRRHDAFWRKAKREGFRSRASFKLIELNRKFRLVKRGDRVVDVGCAPGGWMQVLQDLVGNQGTVVGVDLQDISPFDKDNVFFVRGDIRDEETQRKVMDITGKAHSVVADISPRITGAWSTDQYNSYLLSRDALLFSEKILEEGGTFLVKIFDSPEARELEREARAVFEHVKVSRPTASRKSSAEIYIVCKGFTSLASEAL
jgi:23S rRNA (uridine2552-2'-O)-methyltransferase